MRVLFVLPSFDAGGAENYILRFVRHAGTGEFEWHAMAAGGGKGDLEDALRAAGITLHHQPIGYLNPLKAWRFARLVQQHGFDAVCSLTGVFGGWPLLLSRLVGVDGRVAWHRRASHAFRETWWRRVYAWLGARLLEWNATRILSNSHAALEFFHGPNSGMSSRCRVIPNGVDASSFDADACSVAAARRDLGIPADGRVVGHVGRFDWSKNHETIFRVAAEVSKAHSGVAFVFCGKGTDSEAFRRRLAHHGIAWFCIGLGVRHDMPRVYRTMDLFYFPSLTEGQPNALIEAMLSGVPVLAADIPGIRETVPPGLQRLLVPARDVDAAVARIEAFISGECQDVEATREWAVRRFDPATNFGMFLEALRVSPSRAAHA
ncbi:glycosyltransferase [Thioalkalivibrio sp.]|uniref:glycosyltransferase n=1 Tax=Thioalkalivibrio sp. TaxID=2093813 RepID=UPI00356A6E09